MIKSLDAQYDPVREREREREKEREAWRGTEESLNTQSDGSRDDRREKKGFWDWASQGMERERDKRLLREREKEREEEEHNEITRMIGP